MIFRSAHLGDNGLFDYYVSAKVGEPVDPRTADHLTACADCAAKFDALARFMDGLRADADAELDAVFTPDVLRQQQQRIARRVAAVGHSARVIHFPASALASAPPRGRRSLVPRWAAAAAAAGLFVGVSAGLFFRDRTGGQAPALPAVGIVATQETPSPAVPASASADGDDLFLGEIEVAADGPQTAELLAYDDLTPQIREVSLAVPAR